jgi:hypothetical protein
MNRTISDVSFRTQGTFDAHQSIDDYLVDKGGLPRLAVDKAKWLSGPVVLYGPPCKK